MINGIWCTFYSRDLGLNMLHLLKMNKGHHISDWQHVVCIRFQKVQMTNSLVNADQTVWPLSLLQSNVSLFWCFLFFFSDYFSSLQKTLSVSKAANTSFNPKVRISIWDLIFQIQWHPSVFFFKRAFSCSIFWMRLIS